MRNTLLTSLFIAGVLTAYAQPAYAGCFSNLAGIDLEDYLAGGMTLDEAFAALKEDEYHDGTKKCFIKIRGDVYVNKLTRPVAYRALYGN